MELSRSNTKKILAFSQKKAFLILSQKKTFVLFSKKKAFLIFLEMELCTFHLQAREIKKPTPEKLLTLQETKTLNNVVSFRKLKL